MKYLHPPTIAYCMVSRSSIIDNVVFHVALKGGEE